jgi:restriction system protein
MENIIYELDRLDGHAFEDAVAVLFERLGYSVTRTPKSGDEGRDLILERYEEIIVVECKHQASAVGRPIVQKLHSAVSTYPRAKKGIIVTSSSFSAGASEYARKLKETTGVDIALWDYHALLDNAKPVSIFLTSSRQNTTAYFHVPWRTDSEVILVLKQKYLSKLVSSPRATQDASTLRVDAQEIVPVILVNYKVDKVFATQVGVIHKVSDQGRRVYEIPGHCINLNEQNYWLSSKIHECAIPAIGGKKLPTFFGNSFNTHTKSLTKELTRKHTRIVEYVGRNNQSYSKHCEIKPTDVQTSTQQVLLSKWKVSIIIGPKRYELVLADDASKDLLVISATGFGGGEHAFMTATGMICNDCAQIVPAKGTGSGVSCSSCARTLCGLHRRLYPRRAPLRWRSYCSSCYTRLRTDAEALDSYPKALDNFALLILASLAPGLPFMLGKRPVLGILAAMTTFIAVALACQSEWLSLILSLCFAINICSPIYWSVRVKKHRSNLKIIARYKPEWCDQQTYEFAEEGFRGTKMRL